MKYKLLSLLAFISILHANTITLTGKIETSSVVTFDKSNITSLAYQNNTHIFDAIEVTKLLVVGQRFKVIKDIYTKSNFSNDIEIRLSSSNRNGRLESTNGDKIPMNYTINGTKVKIKNESWVALPSNINSVTKIKRGFKAKSKKIIKATQPNGTYSVVLNVTIRAKI